MNALGGISEWPRHTDCFADAHLFLKYTEKKDTSPNFLPPPGALDAKAQAVCVGRELGVGWVVCVYCLRWPFRNYRGDLTRSLAAKSSYLLCSDAVVGMVTCSLCFLDQLLFPD